MKGDHLMSDRNTTLPTFASLIGKDILSRAFIVALVLGSVLTLINQPNALFGGAAVQVLPLVLVYLTPFIVVAISQALGSHRAIRETQFDYGRPRQNDGFIATAMSHGIPLRALFLATIIGVTNTLITGLTQLVSSGTLSDLPTTVIGQAFILPMLFGLISQTISYRRAAAAINRNPNSSRKLLSN
jgi:hypothetical protein